MRLQCLRLWCGGVARWGSSGARFRWCRAAVGHSTSVRIIGLDAVRVNHFPTCDAQERQDLISRYMETL